MLLKKIILIGFLAVSIGCSQEGFQNCIDDKIDEIVEGRVGITPTKIIRYEYNDQFVYFFIYEGCCDLSDKLYDEGCNFICSFKGWSGGRSGECPDFFTTRTNGVILWEDEGE